MERRTSTNKHTNTVLAMVMVMVLTIYTGARGTVVRIVNVSDFIDFERSVNGGISYEGTTVLLEGDIAFSGESLNPIGTTSNSFEGTFDGQGYRISGVAITAATRGMGLFGTMHKGGAIQNVVLDSTSSLTCTHNIGEDTSIHTGGLVGFCYGSERECSVQNSINMASVSFTGVAPNASAISGGVVGRCVGYAYPCSLRNLVNYGEVAHRGSSVSAFVGGVIGVCEGGAGFVQCEIVNCLNYASVTVSDGKADCVSYVGGIFGYLWTYGYVANCVNAGTLATNTAEKYFGGCGGYLGLYSKGASNYWSADAGSESAFGSGRLSAYKGNAMFDGDFMLVFNATIENISHTTLLEALNNFTDANAIYDLSNWAHNKDNKDVSFVIGSRAYVTLKSRLIMLPTLKSEGKLWLRGWYTDEACTSPLRDLEISSDNTFYGRWEENTNSYTVSFNVNGGSLPAPEPIAAALGTTIDLRNVTVAREGYGLSRWEDEQGDAAPWNFTVPRHNTVLRAVWVRTHIATAAEMAEYADAVRSGMMAADLTVLLEADIDFGGYNGSFGSIGVYDPEKDCSFKGVFDAQGHRISNMSLSSGRQFAGLFGYATFGGTIKNLVFDDTCAIASNFSVDGYSGSVGGIIAKCVSKSAPCVVENCVNMAEIKYTGSSTGFESYAAIGGIMGEFTAGNFGGTIKNCANYGDVLNTGNNYGTSIGGIIGEGWGDLKVQNCINSAFVMDTGSTYENVYLGGIAGWQVSSTIDNCVNIGQVSSSKRDNGLVMGTIVGFLQASTMTNSYWYNRYNYPGYGESVVLSGDVAVRGCYSFDKSSYELSSPVAVGSYTGRSLLYALNAGAEVNVMAGYSGWLVNKDSNSVTFNIDGRPFVSYSSEVVLIPGISSTGTEVFFDAWYTDPGVQAPLGSHEVTADTSLYGVWANKSAVKACTIRFNTTGGSGAVPEAIVGWYGDVVELPRDLEKEGFVFVSWRDSFGNVAQWNFVVPKQNITLYATWFSKEISSAEDLESFALNVNNGLSFFGQTVYMTSDIDLSELTAPFSLIGESSEETFWGTFDGQGYRVSGLNASVTTQAVGLFMGSGMGLTILNLVLDSTCAVRTSYSQTYDVYAGGIIGVCFASGSRCAVENCVSMASVAFTGSVKDSSAFLGGVAGYISVHSDAYEGVVRNCANYGAVSNTGRSAYVSVGGVLGQLTGREHSSSIVQSCLNYGAVSQTGSVEEILMVGGVAGYLVFSSIEGCANMGDITVSVPQLNSKLRVVGSVGGALWKSSAASCFWPASSKYGGFHTELGEEERKTVESFDENFTLGSGGSTTTVVAALNAYAEGMQDFSRWYLNPSRNSVTLVVNGRELASYTSQIVLAAGLARTGRMSFGGWTSKQNVTDCVVTEPTTLEGSWDDRHYGKSFTIRFDTGAGGEAVGAITAEYGTRVILPQNAIRPNRLFQGWTYSNGAAAPRTLTVPGQDLVLYAAWKVVAIASSEDFVDFVKCVNGNNYNYTGMTVRMTSDINLTAHRSVVRPIGDTRMNSFTGTFDGQGHVVSGLAVESSSQGVGLFGIGLSGMSVRNVVLDQTCSLTSTYRDRSTNEGYLGGMLGYCWAYYRGCAVAGCVSMATVVFEGDAGVNVGGMVGYCLGDAYDCRIEDSANYGTVVHAGSSTTSTVGGIAGACTGCTIANNINSGSIHYAGKTLTSLNVGGIIGNGLSRNRIDNCVNTGNITMAGQGSAKKTHVASIAAEATQSNITNCFWSEAISYDPIGEYSHIITLGNYPFDSNYVVKDMKDSTLGDLLNSHSTTSKWITVAFETNGGDKLSPIVVLSGSNAAAVPVPKNGAKRFLGWYIDAGLTKPFVISEICGSGSSSSSDAKVTVYAKWTQYDVSADEATDLVQIIISGKTQEEITTIIKTIAGCDNCYEIAEFNDYGDETLTIIKFVDVEDAKEFVRTIKQNYRTFVVDFIIRPKPEGSMSLAVTAAPIVMAVIALLRLWMQ